MSASGTTIAIAAGVLGATLGLGAYTFVYARGWAYMTDDPRACMNCHVMNEQYDGWIKSSHRSVAVCNDCHVPHSVVPRYATKASNGFWHSYFFTTGGFPEPIRALPKSRAIAEANCRRCHEPVVQAMGTPAHAGAAGISCIRCHGSVGHLELAATNVADMPATHVADMPR
jgi:cytochrome c nitrite reductase small subunit